MSEQMAREHLNQHMARNQYDGRVSSQALHIAQASRSRWRKAAFILCLVLFGLAVVIAIQSHQIDDLSAQLRQLESNR